MLEDTTSLYLRNKKISPAFEVIYIIASKSFLKKFGVNNEKNTKNNIIPNDNIFPADKSK
jgi:hypothetical protein